MGELLVGAYDDPELLDRLADGADVVTYEFENVPVEAARRVEAVPGPAALEVAQDRLAEKQLFRRLGIPTARIDDEVERFPALLKTRRLGYDGKGQTLVDMSQGQSPGHVLEELVPFDRELSLLAVRAAGRRHALLPARRERARGRDPAQLPCARPPTRRKPSPRSTARGSSTSSTTSACSRSSSSRRTASCSRTSSRRACTTPVTGRSRARRRASSRTTCARSSGSRSARPTSAREVAMVNLIGTVPPPERVLAIPGAHLHLYGKEPRPGRKLGHVTLLDPTPERLQALEEAVGTAAPRAG